MQKNSRLIVIDGLDGCGKSTQLDLAGAELNKKNIKYMQISFPDYDKPSSELVKMYLRGDFSQSAEGVNAYAASSFYAVDRYASYKLYWEKEYLDGTLILAGRYVSSNAIHQMVKLNECKWTAFLDWLVDYEYLKLGLPKENKTIFLDMPVEISQKLLTERYGGDESKKDIHEKNTAYLFSCRKAALFAAQKLGWEVIQCSDGEKPFERSEILRKIMTTIQGEY